MADREVEANDKEPAVGDRRLREEGGWVWGEAKADEADDEFSAQPPQPTQQGSAHG